MKPSWVTAPEWAQWIAMDESGKWYWYSCEPCANEKNREWTIDGRTDWNAAVAKQKNWIQTKEERPK